MNWMILKNRLQSHELSLEQFNDVLLLSNQRPIGRAFFERFFSPVNGRVTADLIKKGISRFEGFAMLLYGNVRFAYRKLYQSGDEELKSEMGDYGRSSSDILSELGKRPEVTPLPAEISPEDTWLLGYIAKGAADRDIATYKAMSTIVGAEAEEDLVAKLDKEQSKLYHDRKAWLLQNERWKSILGTLEGARQYIGGIQKTLVETRCRGWMNTSHYLAIDFMDVYVATSMRERWEFEDVSRFVSQLFSSPLLGL